MDLGIQQQDEKCPTVHRCYQIDVFLELLQMCTQNVVYLSFDKMEQETEGDNYKQTLQVAKHI